MKNKKNTTIPISNIQN